MTAGDGISINGNVVRLNEETIYDMTSSDSDINWGYTSGIQGGITITGKDFSKYKRLRFFVCAGHTSNSVVEISLANILSPWGAYYTTAVLGNTYYISIDSGVENIYFSVTVNDKKEHISFDFGLVSGLKNRNLNTVFFVEKIEGVY